MPGRLFARLRTWIVTRLTRRVIVELSWVAAGQLTALIASVLAVKILASRLGAEEYGRLALGLTVPLLLNQFILGPLALAAVRHYAPARETGQLASLVAALNRFLRRLAAVWLAAGILAFVVLAPTVGWGWALLVFSMFVFGLLQNIQGLHNGMQVAARRRAPAAVHQGLEPLARLAAGGGVALAVPRAAAVGCGFAIGVGAVCVSQWLAFRRTVGPAGDPGPEDVRRISRELWRYASYAGVWGLFAFGLLASDRWALKLFRGDAEVGVYAAAVQLAAVASTTVPGLVGQLVNPVVFERAGDATDPMRMASALRAVRAATLAVAAWVAACAFGAALVGPWLLEVFASPAYVAAGPYLAFVVIGLGAVQVGNTLGLVPLAFKQMGAYTAIRAGHSLLAVALNVLGAWLAGIAGVSVSVAIAGVLYVMLILANNVRLGRQLGIQQEHTV